MEIDVTVYSSVLTQKWSTVIWILLKTFFNTCLLHIVIKIKFDLDSNRSRADKPLWWPLADVTLIVISCTCSRFTIYFIIFLYEIMYSFDLIDQLQNIQELQTNEFWAINMKRRMNEKALVYTGEI